MSVAPVSMFGAIVETNHTADKRAMVSGPAGLTPLHSTVHAWYAVGMIALPKRKMTADEFLTWAEGLPKEAGKFEVWDGEVIVTRGPSGFENAERSEHWAAKFAIARSLHDAVKREGLPCHVTGEGPSVRLANNRLVEPDALVYSGEEVPRGVLEVPNPLIVVEVLSPSTQRFDLGDKLDGYFAMPSLHHYLVVDPDLARLIHYPRGAAGAAEPHIVTGPRLRLDPPGLDVDLTEVLAS
jgi:Uma2 family endonuclease